MKPNFLLVVLTAAMLTLSAAIVVSHLDEASEQNDSQVNGGDERSLLSSSLLVTGVSSRVPEANDYTLLKTVPWESLEISRLFVDAGAQKSCQLLDPGVDVHQPLLEPVAGRPGPLGRQPVFSIRLKIGKDLSASLPGVTRGIIEDYLKAHQLTMQISLYQDDQGNLIPGPELRAAFVRLELPEKTVSAESMIASSVGEFRTLGAYWSGTDDFLPKSCRTLILGFRYTLDLNAGTVLESTRREYELVFLHLLPGSTAKQPQLAVFATSDARTHFHLLEPVPGDPSKADAAVVADVRFADVKLFGMYPQSPVVTQVRHKALLSLPVELVRAQMDGFGGSPGAFDFSRLLDDLFSRARNEAEKGMTPPETAPPAEVKPPETT